MRRKFINRMFTLLLSVCLASSTLAGCGNKTVQENSVAPQEENITIEDNNASNAEQEEEVAKKAEEEASKKAEEEAAKQAEEEVAKKAEEEAAKKAEEEASKKAEEERIKVEEEKKLAEQMNSFSMMYYLAITAEDIRTSKNNRLILDEIYTSLLNDINPGSIDETTQDHLQNLRDIIKAYININTKRERLQFIYNQQKAAAIRSAVPNPLAVLSATNAMDWKKLAVNVVYTAVDSYTNYKNANESADTEFLMSGWDLDDEELATVQKNRERAFNYMVDMVQEYGLDGKLTLNEKAIEKFVEICDIESVPEKIRRLNSEEETYKLLGNYWLELADCYFETSQYDKCLECVDKYQELSTGIFRKDYNYAQILPKAIVAAQNQYSGNKNKYETVINAYATDLINNTEKSEEYWSTRYFAAQVYMDLYAKTNKKNYLEKAYDIAYDNVTLLLKEQRDINSTYLNDVVEVTVEEPDYRYLTKNEKKEKENQFKEEKNQAKNYNKALKEARKTELPSIYEPLVVNCELLFALADEMKISNKDKSDIEAILQTATNGTFISKPINDVYSFNNSNTKYAASVTKDKIVLPASLLTADSEIQLIVNDGTTTKTISDCKIKKVERKGKDIDSFAAYISSAQYGKLTWNKDAKLTIKIKYSDVYDKEYSLNYKVREYEKHWYGDKVVFVQE